MANTNRIDVASLDFDSIKANLKDFLRSQSEFKDFDFEAAGINVLLDILAYNTHYMGWFQNMLANEMFLDSAKLRANVVSIAKHLAYVPRSIRAARATMSVTITPPINDTQATAVIERFTKFTARVGDNVYEFLTTKAYTANKADGAFVFPEIEVIQGVSYRWQQTIDSRIEKQRFLLPNALVDTSTLLVRIQRSVADNRIEVYNYADDITEVTKDSRVYFLQEVEDGKFEIYFGDGTVGKKPVDGNIVLMDYIITSGPDANGATLFSPANKVAGYPAHNTTITTITQSHGGAAAETTEQIKFTAPKNWEAQNRAVTKSDYKVLVSKDYPIAESVAVWGGEENVPPAYGKVFVSIKPADGFVVTEEAKRTVVKDILRKRNIVSVIPEVIDPDYTYITVTSKIRYQPSLTDKSQGEIEDLSIEAITEFNTTELGKFERMLKYSRLLSAIDNTDSAISNNLTTIKMKKVFRPRLAASTNYTFMMHNPVMPKSFISSRFVVTQDPLIEYLQGDEHFLEDDGSGNLWITRVRKGNTNLRTRTAGTINYETGDILIQELNPFLLVSGSDISITMTPAENDIVPRRNNILFILPADINVTAVPLES